MRFFLLDGYGLDTVDQIKSHACEGRNPFISNYFWEIFLCVIDRIFICLGLDRVFKQISHISLLSSPKEMSSTTKLFVEMHMKAFLLQPLFLSPPLIFKQKWKIISVVCSLLLTSRCSPSEVKSCKCYALLWKWNVCVYILLPSRDFLSPNCCKPPFVTY